MGEAMIKITTSDNQYALNANTGLVVVFDSAEFALDMMLILKRKVDGKSIGVATLMYTPMYEALEIMHELGIKVVKL